MKPKTAGCDGGTNHQSSPDSRDPHRAAAPSDDIGLVWGTQVVTMHGLKPVEKLSRGDRLVTRGHGSAPIRSIRQVSLVCRAVYVIAGSLGHGRPDRDGLVPTGQTVLVRDWRARAFAQTNDVLIRARDLVDGEFVRDIGLMPMTLYQIYCDGPRVIYGDGMELGTADAAANTAFQLRPTS